MGWRLVFFFLFVYFSCAFHAFILNNVMKQQHITIYKIVILFIQTSYFIAGESQEEEKKKYKKSWIMLMVLRAVRITWQDHWWLKNTFIWYIVHKYIVCNILHTKYNETFTFYMVNGWLIICGIRGMHNLFPYMRWNWIEQWFNIALLMLMGGKGYLNEIFYIFKMKK